MEVGLVLDPPRENRAPAFHLHLHPFERNSVSLAKLSTYYYPVDGARAHVGPLFVATASSYVCSVERRAGEDRLSSPRTTFPLGDSSALAEGFHNVSRDIFETVSPGCRMNSG